MKNSFNIDENKDFKNWCITKNKEQLNSKLIGLNVSPSLKKTDSITLRDASLLKNFSNYKLKGESSVTQSGIDLQALYKINVGGKDFNDKQVNTKCLGACTQP